MLVSAALFSHISDAQMVRDSTVRLRKYPGVSYYLNHGLNLVVRREIIEVITRLLGVESWYVCVRAHPTNSASYFQMR